MFYHRDFPGARWIITASLPWIFIIAALVFSIRKNKKAWGVLIPFTLLVIVRIIDLYKNYYVSIDVTEYILPINFSLALIMLFSNKIAHRKCVVIFIISLFVMWVIGFLFLINMEPFQPYGIMIKSYCVFTLGILLGIMLTAFIMRKRLKPILFIILNFVIYIIIAFSTLTFPILDAVITYRNVFLSNIFSSIIVASCPLFYLVFVSLNKYYRERLFVLLKLKINQNASNKENMPLS